MKSTEGKDDNASVAESSKTKNFGNKNNCSSFKLPSRSDDLNVRVALVTYHNCLLVRKMILKCPFM